LAANDLMPAEFTAAWRIKFDHLPATWDDLNDGRYFAAHVNIY